MRAIRLATLGATLLVATACATRRESGQAGKAATEDRLIPAVQDAQLTPNELAMFASLPARMDAPGKRRATPKSRSAGRCTTRRCCPTGTTCRAIPATRSMATAPTDVG